MMLTRDRPGRVGGIIHDACQFGFGCIGRRDQHQHERGWANAAGGDVVAGYMHSKIADVCGCAGNWIRRDDDEPFPGSSPRRSRVRCRARRQRVPGPSGGRRRRMRSLRLLVAELADFHSRTTSTLTRPAATRAGDVEALFDRVGLDQAWVCGRMRIHKDCAAVFIGAGSTSQRCRSGAAISTGVVFVEPDQWPEDQHVNRFVGADQPFERLAGHLTEALTPVIRALQPFISASSRAMRIIMRRMTMVIMSDGQWSRSCSWISVKWTMLQG